MRVTSNIPEVSAKYLKGLEKQVDAAVYRAMVKTGLVGESRVKGIIAKEAHDTGRLLRSVHAVIRRGPDELRLVIASSLEYAVMVEEGRKPGSGHGKNFPNLDALVGWVARKIKSKGGKAFVTVTFDQLKEKAKVEKGKKPTATAKAAREQLAVIYLVGRKIATKGIKEKLIFKRIEDGLLALFRQNVRKELESVR